MHCPYCRHPDSRVVDSRVADDGSAIRRRRQCAACGRRFSTLETTAVNVIKRSGATEPFKRAKIISGVRKACQGRPVSEDDLALLAQEVEESIRAKGLAEIDANDVGLEILKPLQRLDTVAYLRFASVYQAFEGLDDFESAIRTLRGAEEDVQQEAGPTGAGASGREAQSSSGQGGEARRAEDRSSRAAESGGTSRRSARTGRRSSSAGEEDPEQPTLI